MKHTIDIKLLKENPQLLFSQLNKESEKELSNLLSYFIFKYNIIINDKEEVEKRKFDFFVKNPINVEKVKKYTREELHER